MNFGRIGHTDLNCSVIGLGTSRLASVSGGVSRRTALKLIGVAEDCGINLIDTADSYAQGECEKIIGQALRRKRSKFVVATKAGFCFSGFMGGARFLKPVAKRVLKYFKGGRSIVSSARANVAWQDFASGHIRNSIESSLRRLQTDYLDIFLLHSPPAQSMADQQLFDLLRQLKQQGKIRYFGVSSQDPAVLESALGVAGLSVVQTPVNPAQTGNAGILPKLQAGKVGVVASQVFLSGKLMNSGGEGNEISALRARLGQLAAQKGISLSQLLIEYALSQPGRDSILTGTTNPEHLRQNVADAISSTVLSPQDLNFIVCGKAVEA